MTALITANRTMHDIRNNLGIRCINNHSRLKKRNRNDWVVWYDKRKQNNMTMVLPFKEVTKDSIQLPSLYQMGNRWVSLPNIKGKIRCVELARPGLCLPSWNMEMLATITMEDKIATCEDIAAVTFYELINRKELDRYNIYCVVHRFWHHCFCLIEIPTGDNVPSYVIVDPWIFFFKQ